MYNLKEAAQNWAASLFYNHELQTNSTLVA